MKKQAPRIVVPPHPGPMRMNRSDPGFHGILIAIGFAALGIIGLPLYRIFFVGTVVFGVVTACLLSLIRKTKKNPSGLFPLDLSSQEGPPSENVSARDPTPDNQPLDIVPAFAAVP